MERACEVTYNHHGIPIVTAEIVGREASCLRAIRAELTATYPRVRPVSVLRILRRHGLSRFPAGLLLDAPVRSLGPRGALALLFRAGHPRLAQGVHWHPLFSAAFYGGVNPDVVAAGADPWLHYQVYGRTEGRSPHPLIDLDYLSAGVPGTLRAELVDAYLGDPALWRTDPGPYVECVRFLLAGPWDGTTHPLVQIARDHLTSPWVHQRLMLVDAQAPGTRRALVIAAAVLLTRNASAGMAALQLWSPPTVPRVEGAREYTVVPGMFVGASGGTIVAAGSDDMSADSSVLRAGEGFASLRRGAHHTASTLVVITGQLDDESLHRVGDHAGSVVVAPFSAAQYEALGALATDGRVRLLEPGIQARVTADALVVEAA